MVERAVVMRKAYNCPFRNAVIRQGTECRQGAFSYSDYTKIRRSARHTVQVRFGGSPQSIHPSWIGLFRVREWAPRDKFVPRVFWCLKSHVNNRILNIWWTERVWHETDLYPDLISGHLNRAVASWVGEMLVPNWVPAPTDRLTGYPVPGDHESKGAPKLSAPIPISDTSPSGYL